jgi:hypothetical protein
MIPKNEMFLEDADLMDNCGRLDEISLGKTLQSSI